MNHEGQHTEVMQKGLLGICLHVKTLPTYTLACVTHWLTFKSLHSPLCMPSFDISKLKLQSF